MRHPGYRQWIGFGLIAPLLAVWISASHTAETLPADKVRMIGQEGEAAKYWPCWRGPTGQGIADRGDYPHTWSDTENVLWKVEIPGRGNSSPIIWKDRLFLTTAQDNGKRRAILCLDRASGKLLWEKFAPEATREGANGKNGHASSTPVTDGERIYAYLGNQGLWCIDLNGKEVWHQKLGEIRTLHGPAGSPLLYRDRVILYQERGGKSGSFVAAFDRKTGKQLWSTPRRASVGWGSPVAIKAGDRDEIVVSSQSRVMAYDPASGKELWSCGGNLSEVTPTPVVGHGLLFCCSGRQGPTLAITPGGSGDVTKSHVVWKVNRDSPFIPSPVLNGDYLFMVNDMNSLASCYEAKTGKQMWQRQLGRATAFSASAVSAGDKVFFTNDNGETFVVKAAPKFELLAVNRLKARTLASPALLDGRWYWRTDRHLVCVGKK